MKYQFKTVLYDRWAVWYKDFEQKKGNRIGCYKIIDLYAGTREHRLAIRYTPRKDQTQEQSDNAIIGYAIHSFYKRKIYMGNRTSGDAQETNA